MNTTENDINTHVNIIPTSKRGQNRTNYKYTDGWVAHYKETNHNKVYYSLKNIPIQCGLCSKMTDTFHIKQHQKTKICTKLRCEATPIEQGCLVL